MTDLFPAAIRTERLWLVNESETVADVRDRYASMNEDAIEDGEFAYIPIEPFVHVGEAREFVERRVERAEAERAGAYVVRPREGEDGAGELAGEAELVAQWDDRMAFMTFGLRKRFWGRGYSAERAAALLKLAFERLDLDLVSVTHLPENENSRRAIEKYVDRFDGERVGRFRNQYVLDGEAHDVVRYEITREDYEASGERVAAAFHEAVPADAVADDAVAEDATGEGQR